jgi:hypothetical protein
MSEIWELFALTHPGPQQPPKKFLHGNSTVQVESEHSTLHTKQNLEKKTPFSPQCPPTRKQGKDPSLHDKRLLIGCMEILFLILGATIFGLD